MFGMNNMTDNDRAIIPQNLAIRAMRDNGYKNTAYALAELIDNAVQAEASVVEVICFEVQKQVGERKSKRIDTIGILDNGKGMSSEILQLALQFGNGTHLEDRKGMGRFGMGLPNSSISQCRKVEVWTWQSGPDNAMYSHLDIDEIEEGALRYIPEPECKPLPDEWHIRSNNIGTTGTLILWSKLDDHRLSWRGAKATFKNTELLVGRLYRKFIDSGRLQINLLSFCEGEQKLNESVRVNDPLYLMKNSSTPPPFDANPMFQKWGDNDEVFDIDYNGEKHNVAIRISWAREETISSKKDRGSEFYGKHAAKNIGLSIIREGRELDLDSAWANSYDPTERWWGIEVEFPSTLDEIFGVTNTKQSATILSRMADLDWKEEAEHNENLTEFIERLKADGDPRALLVEIVNHIHQQIPQIRKRLKSQTKGRRASDKRHDEPDASDLATAKFRLRAEQGHVTESDKKEFTESDKDSLIQDLVKDKHQSEDIAKKIAQATVDRKRKVLILDKEMDGYAFFAVESKQGGLTEIIFNQNHPFYDQIIEVLKPNIANEETDAHLLHRIHKAANTLDLLFAAWARYELEETQDKSKLFEMRQEWGKMVRVFLEEGNGN